ncbi:MAG: glycosyltransferase [Phycisphaerales bacterium]|nr:glycosyltransferase [Phycisphaerales bacterium]
MRVSLLITDLNRGGAPLRIARLARGLRDAGHHVSVGCLAELGPVGGDLRDAGFDVFAAGARSVLSFGVFGRLERALRDRSPHIIHSTLVHANFAARVVGRRMKTPVITSTATVEVERRWHALVERWTRKWDCGHIVNSRVLADHVIRAFGRDPRRVFVVPPSAEMVAPPSRDEARRALGLPLDAFVIAWAGRLDPVKRVDMLIDAFDRIAGKPGGSGARLLIAGEGADRARIERRLTASPFANQISMLGWMTDVARVFAAADCVAIPSRTEGMPNVVLEAMAIGVPVIASPLPVMCELAGPADAPRLLLMGDGTAAALTSAIERVRANRDEASEAADRASHWVRTELSVEETTRATLRAYERCLEGKTA